MKFLFSKLNPIFLVIFALMLAVSTVAEAGPKKPRKAKLKVVSYNLYVGADIFGVFTPQPCGVPQAVYDLHSTIQQTDFPARAEAIADQIATQEPHVIGLQEVSLLRTQYPGDSLIAPVPPRPGDTLPRFTFVTNAVDISYDYLQLLLDALAARGLDYVEVSGATAVNADVEFPAIPFDEACNELDFPTDVRLTDRDVILVRSDLEVNLEVSGNFAFNAPIEVPVELPGPVIALYTNEFTRGWGALNVTIKDHDFSIVNTHLEVGDSAALPDEGLNLVQYLQAMELKATYPSLPLPHVLVGDINSSSEPTDPRPAYFVLTNPMPDLGLPFPFPMPYQLEDIWDIQFKPPLDEGFTCCQNEYVDNLESELHERIDVIFADFGDLEEKLDKAKFEVLGDQPADATPSGLWPSDHAGVAAKIEFDR